MNRRKDSRDKMNLYSRFFGQELRLDIEFQRSTLLRLAAFFATIALSSVPVLWCLGYFGVIGHGWR